MPRPSNVLSWQEQQAYKLAPELVFGLVGSVGVKLGRVSEHLETALRQVNYRTEHIRLSDLLHSIDWASAGCELLPGERRELPRDDDIQRHQDAGDRLRRLTKRGDALAVLAIADIRRRRARAARELKTDVYPASEASDQSAEHVHTPGQLPLYSELDTKAMLVNWQAQSEATMARTAFILRSLKHPDEARTLRTVYGRRFCLVAIHLPSQNAIEDLARQIAASEQEEYADAHHRRARRLYDREANPDAVRSSQERTIQAAEGDPYNAYGQNVRDTYRHADVFIDANGGDEFILAQLSRFVGLIFGDPFLTPTSEEQAMMHAQAAALRSSVLARQVGAAVADSHGAIVATGTNEVPKAKGGFYWYGDNPDGRDFAYHDGDDSNDLMRRSILREMLDRLEQLQLFTVEKRRSLPFDDLIAEMKTSRVWRLTEFGRAVHAEMAAITDAARRGVSIEGCIVYTTTYPCHSCARHALAAGVKCVIYMEPYAKSLAQNLHEDAIVRDFADTDAHHILFRQFIGVTPRRFTDVFARHSYERKDPSGHAKPFDADRATPRSVDAQPFYQLSEYTDVIALRDAMTEAKLSLINPQLLVEADYDAH